MGRSLIGAVLSAPQWPAAKDPYTWNSAAGSAKSSRPILPSTLNDGSYIVPTSASITLYNASGTAVWTKAPAEVNASATSFLVCVWIDTVDGALYGLGNNNSNTQFYPFKIAISTGTLTEIGASGFAIPAAFIGSQNPHLTRAAQGSGDFTLFGGGSPASQPPQQISFSSSTGAVTLALANVMSGTTAIGNQSASPFSVSYRSLDGTILLSFQFYYQNQSTSQIVLALVRGGKVGFFAPQMQMSCNGNSNQTANLMTVVGNSVLLTNGLIQQFQIPMMLRSDFDTFLAAACTYMGI